MSILVAVQQRVPVDLIGSHLDNVREEFATSAYAQPGRVHERVFQSLQDPGHLLSVCEWRDESELQSYLGPPEERLSDGIGHGTRRIWQLFRLRHVAHMAQRVAVVACAIISGPPVGAGSLAQVGLSRSRQTFQQQAGLVSVELYRLGDAGNRFLSIHGWRSLDDLLAFMAAHGDAINNELHEHEATIERFAGTVAAEFGAASPWEAASSPPWMPRGELS
ncbi:MAG: hypothetical protein IT306_26375 [Chloroflexi bacterium]|nr:hypothetical protein [Chloroflexota bacterium]